jgi:hypothetical protein
MSSDVATAAARFGALRPGFELVAAEEVGLPFYRLSLEVTMQERNDLPAIDEFVLRAVRAGLTALDDVVGLLGLDRVLVERAVVTQSHQDALDYRYEPGEESRTIHLTELGDSVLSDAFTRLPKRTAVDVAFDRLLWRPTGRLMTQLLKPKQAREFGIREIPPRLKKRLAVDDLDVDEVERAVRELPVRTFRQCDLLAVSNVGNARHVLPAVMLVFAAEDSSSTQVAFIVDGRLSAEHERAFVEVDGPERCDLAGSARPKVDEIPILDELDEPLRAAYMPREKVVDLQFKVGAGLNDITRTGTATETIGPRSADPGSRDDEVPSSDAASLAAAQLAAAPIRALQTYEHRVLLQEALDETRTRLLLISPWIRSQVVDRAFVDRLEALCRKRVRIHIGYGISSVEADPDSDTSALRALEDLHGDFPRPSTCAGSVTLTRRCSCGTPSWS